MTKNDKGLPHRFTLIEILVGILLLGVVFSGAYNILYSVPSTAAEHQHLLLGTRQGWNTVDRLAALIRIAPYRKASEMDNGFSLSAEMGQVEFPDDVIFSQKTESFFPGRVLPADIIRIPRLFTDSENSETEPFIMEYTVKYDDERQLYGMFRRQIDVNERVNEGDWELVSKHVLGFQARFLEENGEDLWERGWGKRHPPQAVELSVWVRVSAKGQPLELESFRSVVNVDYGRVIRFR